MSKYHSLVILSEAKKAESPPADPADPAGELTTPTKKPKSAPRTSIGDIKKLKIVHDDSVVLSRALGVSEQEMQQYLYGYSLLQAMQPGASAQSMSDLNHIETFRKLRDRNPNSRLAQMDDKSGAEYVSKNTNEALQKARDYATGKSLDTYEKYVETPTKYTKDAEGKYNDARKAYQEAREAFEKNSQYQESLDLDKIMDTVIRSTKVKETVSDNANIEKLGKIIEAIRQDRVIRRNPEDPTKDTMAIINNVIATVADRLNKMYPDKNVNDIMVPWIADTKSGKVSTEGKFSTLADTSTDKIPEEIKKLIHISKPNNPLNAATTLDKESDAYKQYNAWKNDYINKLINLQNMFRMYGYDAKAHLIDRIYFKPKKILAKMLSHPTYFKWLKLFTTGNNEIAININESLTDEQKAEWQAYNEKWIDAEERKTGTRSEVPIDVQRENLTKVVLNNLTDEQVTIYMSAIEKTTPISDILTKNKKVDIKTILKMYGDVTGKYISAGDIEQGAKLETPEDLVKLRELANSRSEMYKQRMVDSKDNMDTEYRKYKNSRDPVISLTSIIVEKLAKMGLDSHQLKDRRGKTAKIELGKHGRPYMVAIGKTMYRIVIILTTSGRISARIRKGAAEDPYTTPWERRIKSDPTGKVGELVSDAAKLWQNKKEGLSDDEKELLRHFGPPEAREALRRPVQVESYLRMMFEEDEIKIKPRDKPDPAIYGESLPSWLEMYDSVWQSPEVRNLDHPSKTDKTGKKVKKWDAAYTLIYNIAKPVWRNPPGFQRGGEGSWIYDEQALENKINDKDPYKANPQLTKGERFRKLIVDMYELYGNWGTESQKIIKANANKRPIALKGVGNKDVDEYAMDIVNRIKEITNEVTRVGPNKDYRVIDRSLYSEINNMKNKTPEQKAALIKEHQRLKKILQYLYRTYGEPILKAKPVGVAKIAPSREDQEGHQEEGGEELKPKPQPPAPIKTAADYQSIRNQMRQAEQQAGQPPLKTESIVVEAEEADEPIAQDEPPPEAPHTPQHSYSERTTIDLDPIETPVEEKLKGEANYIIYIYIPKSEFIEQPGWSGIYSDWNENIVDEIQDYASRKNFGVGEGTSAWGELDKYAREHKAELLKEIEILKAEAQQDTTPEGQKYTEVINSLAGRVEQLDAITAKVDSEIKAIEAKGNKVDTSNLIAQAKSLIIQMDIISQWGDKLMTTMRPFKNQFKSVKQKGEVKKIQNHIKRQFTDIISRIPAKYLTKPMKSFMRAYGRPTYGMIFSGKYVFNGFRLFNGIHDAMVEIAESADPSEKMSLNIKDRTYNELAQDIVTHLLSYHLKQGEDKSGAENSDLIEDTIKGIVTADYLLKNGISERALRHLYPEYAQQTEQISSRMVFGIQSKTLGLAKLNERIRQGDARNLVIKIAGRAFKPKWHSDTITLDQVQEIVYFDQAFDNSEGTIKIGDEVQFVILPKPMITNINGKNYRTYVLRSNTKNISLNKMGRTTFSWDDPSIQTKYVNMLWAQHRDRLSKAEPPINYDTLTKMTPKQLAGLAVMFFPVEVKQDQQTNHELIVTIPRRMLAYSLEDEETTYDAINKHRQQLERDIIAGLKTPRLPGYVTRVYDQNIIRRISDNIKGILKEIRTNEDKKDNARELLKNKEIDTRVYDIAIRILDKKIEALKRQSEVLIQYYSETSKKLMYSFQADDLIGQNLEPGESTIILPELGERKVIRFDQSTGSVSIEKTPDEVIQAGTKFTAKNIKPEFETAVVRSTKKTDFDIGAAEVARSEYQRTELGLVDKDITGPEGANVHNRFKNYCKKIDDKLQLDRSLRAAAPVARNFEEHRRQLMLSRWEDFATRGKVLGINDIPRLDDIFTSLVKLYDPDIVSEYGDPYMSKEQWLSDVFDIKVEKNQDQIRLTGGNSLLAMVIDKDDPNELQLVARIMTIDGKQQLKGDPVSALITQMLKPVKEAYPSTSEDETRRWLVTILNYAPSTFFNIVLKFGFQTIPAGQREAALTLFLKKNYPRAYFLKSLSKVKKIGDEPDVDLSKYDPEHAEAEELPEPESAPERFPDDLLLQGKEKLLNRIAINVKKDFHPKKQQEGQSDQEYKADVQNKIDNLIKDKQVEFLNAWNQKESNPELLNQLYNDPYWGGDEYGGGLFESRDRRLDVILENVRSAPILRRLVYYVATRDENNIHNLYTTVLEHIRRAPRTERDKFRKALEILG